MTIVFEDVFFYLDLTKDIIKKKDIVRAINNYITEKNKTNLKGHYGLLIFQEEGNPIFITDKKDSSIITKAIDKNWGLRPKQQSFFENGLFYIFSYIAESVRKKSKYYRVIVITDTPSDLNDEYQEALFNLVSKIKYFPTFIDIIRVSSGDTRFFKDDVKLNILASDTKGGIFQVKNKKEFNDIFSVKLIKGKQLVSTFQDRPDEIKISIEDYAFYSNLAKDLNPPQSWEGLLCFFCNETICPVCADVYDVPIMCPECGSSFHHCCVTNFTIIHNIGIPHIFRCPKCDILLKIDVDEIVDVSGEEGITSVKEYIGIDEAPQIISVEDITSEFAKPALEIPKLQIPPTPKIDEGVIKKIHIGGFFGKVYSVRKIGDKLIYERSSSYKAVVETKAQGQKHKPQSVKVKMRFCSICGTPAKKGQLKCSNCDSQL